MFQLSHTKIDSDNLARGLISAEAGAMVSFEGRVRNNNEGKSVLRLEYEAFEQLAQNEAEKVIAEARSKFPIIDVCCVHRVGSLEIGDLAVWVGVLSRHRGEGFAACRYVIDEIKARVPIWKKEHYTDGSATWVNCAECASHAHSHANNSTNVGHADKVCDETGFNKKQSTSEEGNCETLQTGRT